MRPRKTAQSVKRAKALRQDMSLPEVLLWQILRASPGGHKFRRQHPFPPYTLDFYCARANLAIEIDGRSHDFGDQPQRDEKRDGWWKLHRVDTLRISAQDVLRDVVAVAEGIVGVVEERLVVIGKVAPAPPSAAPPSVLRTATSPSPFDKLRVDGEELSGKSFPMTCIGEVAPRSGDGGATYGETS